VGQFELDSFFLNLLKSNMSGIAEQLQRTRYKPAIRVSFFNIYNTEASLYRIH